VSPQPPLHCPCHQRLRWGCSRIACASLPNLSNCSTRRACPPGGVRADLYGPASPFAGCECSETGLSGGVQTGQAGCASRVGEQLGEPSRPHTHWGGWLGGTGRAARAVRPRVRPRCSEAVAFRLRPLATVRASALCYITPPTLTLANHNQQWNVTPNPKNPNEPQASPSAFATPPRRCARLPPPLSTIQAQRGGCAPDAAAALVRSCEQRPAAASGGRLAACGVSGVCCAAALRRNPGGAAQSLESL
jgi:hypothetical protein